MGSDNPSKHANSMILFTWTPALGNRLPLEAFVRRGWRQRIPSACLRGRVPRLLALAMSI